MQQRYQELGLAAALSRHLDYAQACKELVAILKGGYKHAPKRLQAQILNDVLAAIHFVPELETGQQLSAVDELVQGAEYVLPRQKKALVLSEYKHAAIVQHRRCKSRIIEEGYYEFSKDILINIFGYLDARSLATAAVVCRFWNVVAKDESLWKALFSFHFRDSNLGFVKISKLIDSDNRSTSCIISGKSITDQQVSWKKMFESVCTGHPLRIFMSNRAFCTTCDSFIWLEGARKGVPMCSLSHSEQHAIKPLVPVQVLQILLTDTLASSSSSSSESDSDTESAQAGGNRVSKIWAFPKLHSETNADFHELREGQLSAMLEEVSGLQLG